MYDTMLVNSEKLSAVGMYISAESMINYRTHTKLSGIHKLIKDMASGTRFTRCMPQTLLPLCPYCPWTTRKRHPPIAGCPGSGHVDAVRNASLLCLRSDDDDQEIIRRLRQEPNVTVRNDPDGRNRVNVNLFSGDVYVTDFADIPAFGNIKEQKLDDIFNEWTTGHPLNQTVNCHCDAVRLWAEPVGGRHVLPGCGFQVKASKDKLEP